MLIHKYKDQLLESFYLDNDDITIRRSHDGYHGKYIKHDIVDYYTGSKKQPYPMIHIPKTRSSIKRCHLICLLRNISLPKVFVIDHIDGDITNDNRNNLRVVTQFLNCRNRAKRSDNTSGITGIHWSDYHNHYVIRKVIKGKRISHSRKTLDEAKQVLQQLCQLDSTYTKRHGK